MGMITAQVSLYPLRQEAIGPPIREAVRVFRQHGLETRIGAMSTLVWGEEQTVFAATRWGYGRWSFPTPTATIPTAWWDW